MFVAPLAASAIVATGAMLYSSESPLIVGGVTNRETAVIVAATLAAVTLISIIVDVGALVDMFFPRPATKASPRSKWWAVFRGANWLLSSVFLLCFTGLVACLRAGHGLLAVQTAPFLVAACLLLSYLFFAFACTVLFRDLGLRTTTPSTPSTSSCRTRASAAALVLAAAAMMPACLCVGFVYQMAPQLVSLCSGAALYTASHALTLEAVPWVVMALVLSAVALRERCRASAAAAAADRETPAPLSDRDRRRLASYPAHYPNGWFKVAESVDLKPGQVKYVQAAGQDFAVYRGKQGGKVHVLDAYCPHLGANLAVGGKVQGDCLECPFHHWQFAGDGSVATIPYSDALPRAGQGAHAWPCVEYYGLVLVYVDADRRPPPYAPPAFESLDAGGMVFRGRHAARNVRQHIQEFAENAVDNPHFSVLHGNMMVPWTTWTVPLLQVHHDASWEVGTKEEGKHISHFRNRAQLKIFGKLIPNTHAFADITFIGPAGVVAFTFDVPNVGRIIMFQCHTPLSPMELKTEFTWYADKSIPRLLVSYVVGNWVSQWANDLLMWENKVFARRPVLVKGDGPVPRMRAWYRQFYASGKPLVEVNNGDGESGDDTPAPAPTPTACAAADVW